MLKKSNIQKILELFFQYPTKKFHIRGIARILSISAPTVSRLIELLVKENLVRRNKTVVLDEVRANKDSSYFKRLKRLNNLKQLYECGLVDYLSESMSINGAVVLFGSYAEGVDWEESDIDLAILSSARSTFNLRKFEKKLARRISIHTPDLKQVSKEFKLNLVNGVVLEGYIDKIL